MMTAISRGALIIIAVCAIVWALNAFAVYYREAPIIDVARRAKLGERFNEVQLNAARKGLEEVAPATAHSAGLNSLAHVRVLLAESELRDGRRAPVDLSDLELVVRTTLSVSPTNSFAWLIGAWIRRQQQTAEANLSMLRMSYRTGPNEAWIAVIRNPLALSVLPLLSSELTEQVLNEFAALVRAGLYAEAANILTGSGWAVRDQLLGKLVSVDEDNRRQFARVLASKDIDVKVHGIETSPYRRF